MGFPAGYTAKIVLFTTSAEMETPAGLSHIDGVVSSLLQPSASGYNYFGKQHHLVTDNL